MWKRWKLGWGESFILTPGLTLAVGKEMDNTFYGTVFNLKLRHKFDTIELAKEACESTAERLLKQALEKLTNDS